MGIWPDIAEWLGPVRNQGDGDSTPNEPGDRIVVHMYVVEHIAEGSYAGTISWVRNPSSGVSCHFVVAKDGRCAQMVDTSIRAWTQRKGNPYSISIENEGHLPAALTPQQVEKSAQILARAHQVHGIPLQITNRVGIRGLGHHSMGSESGVDWGHSQCPGAAIKAQKPLILAQAVAIVNGDDMAFKAAADLFAKLLFDDWDPTDLKAWEAAGGDPAVYALLGEHGSDRNKLRQHLDAQDAAIAALATQLAELKARPQVDPLAVATALAANGEFAEAVARDTAARIHVPSAAEIANTVLELLHNRLAE
jgi:hypothetical protein